MYRYQTNKSKMPRGVNASEETTALLIEAEEQGFTIYTRSGDYTAYTRMCGQVHQIKQGLADLSQFDKKTWRKSKSEIVYKSGIQKWMLGNIGYNVGVHGANGKKTCEMTDSEVESQRLYNRARKARTAIKSGIYKLSDYDKNYRVINKKKDGRTVDRPGGHSFTEWMVGNEGYRKYVQQDPRIKIADKTPEQRIQARGYNRAQDAKKQIASGKRLLSDYNPDYTLHTTEMIRNGHKLPATSVRIYCHALVKKTLPEVPSWCLERDEPRWKLQLQETPEHLIFG
jgi:hypothetical protein